MHEIKSGYCHDSHTDVDECDMGTAVCPDHSYCKNTGGSYNCACTNKYKEVWDGDQMTCKGKLCFDFFVLLFCLL